MSKKLPKPNWYVGGYSLDLYCDRRHAVPEIMEKFFGKDFHDCAREARKNGWIIHRRTRTATCPACSGKIMVTK